MGGCPVCGSDQRSPLAPGLWRCDGIVMDQWVVMVPAPSGPPGTMVPVPCSRERTCAHEYYEAPSADGGDMQFCAICDSNGAIGRCANDHRMVCGYCSQMTAGRRICNECAATAAAEAAQAQATAQEAAEEAVINAWRAKLAPALPVLASLGDVKDEGDRILVLMLLTDQLRTYFMSDSVATDATYETLRAALVSAARSAFAHPTSLMWDLASDFPNNWTCDPKAIMDHFRAHGRFDEHGLTALTLVSREKRPLRGMGEVKRPASGWKIRSASGPGDGKDIYVLTDWMVVVPPPGERRVDVHLERSSPALREIHRLIRAGHLTPPVLPDSLPLGCLTGVTIPWLP